MNNQVTPWWVRSLPGALPFGKSISFSCVDGFVAAYFTADKLTCVMFRGITMGIPDDRTEFLTMLKLCRVNP